MHLLRMGKLGAGHLPVFFAITFTAMLGTTYVFSVWRGDVDPVFPYISTSGDARPESCVFSMFLNLCSFFTMLMVALRYSLIFELNREHDRPLEITNRVAMYIGIFGGIGMFIVANFQETAVIQIHLTGAFMSFGSGAIYMLAQAWISFRMHPHLAGRTIAHVRLWIAVASISCFCIALFFGILASRTFHQFYPNLPTPRPWSRKYSPMPGYEYHCISAVAEWTLAVLNILFTLSFSREFEKIRVDFTVVPLVTHLSQSPIWQSTDDLS